MPTEEIQRERTAHEEREQLLARLSASVNAHRIDTEAGGNGFLAPFAALVLSEVARTDRVEPWMSDEQRAALVETGASYVESVRDYRGFIEGEGWRHGVAHGADLLMQLSLNPAIGEEEAERIMRAVGSQIASNEAPAFIFDEPRRLARLLSQAARLDAINKGAASGRAWDELVTLTLRLSGKPARESAIIANRP